MNGFRSKLLDCRCPIDWSHPLNRGLQQEWAVTPLAGWNRSLVWRDLVRKGSPPNNGTLNGGSVWQGSSDSGLGRYGAIKFNGSSGYVLDSANRTYGTSGSVAYVGTIADNAYAFGAVASAGPTNCIIQWNTADGTLMRSDGAVGVLIGAPPSAGPGVTQAVLTWGPVGAAAYLKGIPLSGLTSLPCTTTFTFDFPMAVGARDLRGSFDGLSTNAASGWATWNRQLSAAEVMALYEEYRQGNPNSWRWISTAKWFLPSGTPPTFNAGWATGATKGVIGCGTY